MSCCSSKQTASTLDENNRKNAVLKEKKNVFIALICLHLTTGVALSGD